MRTCSIAGCNRPHNAHGLCTVHERRKKRYGDPLEGGPIKEVGIYRTCTIENCDREHYAKSWCLMHYKRHTSHGSPLAIVKPRITGNRCSVEGCDEKTAAHNLCAYHYERSPHARAVRAKYRRENPEVGREALARRRARVARATPSWQSQEDREKIKEIYQAAALCDMHVDHIVPIRGKNVWGLHVPWNLQLLTKEENLTKNNKVDHELLRELWTQSAS